MNGTLSKFQIINDMGNGQAAICLLTGSSRATYVFKVAGLGNAVEKSPARALANQGKQSPDALFDISGHKINKPIHNGVYLVREQGKIAKKIYLR
jgi:hypothetical protein